MAEYPIAKALPATPATPYTSTPTTVLATTGNASRPTPAPGATKPRFTNKQLFWGGFLFLLAGGVAALVFLVILPNRTGTPYEIKYFYSGPTMDPTYKAAFESARTRVASLLKTTPGTASFSTSTDVCDAGVLFLGPTDVVEDIVIIVSVTPIDGIGGTLAQAGWCHYDTR